MRCKVCHHYAFARHLREYKHCPLCHAKDSFRSAVELYARSKASSRGLGV